VRHLKGKKTGRTHAEGQLAVDWGGKHQGCALVGKSGGFSKKGETGQMKIRVRIKLTAIHERKLKKAKVWGGNEEEARRKQGNF